MPDGSPRVLKDRYELRAEIGRGGMAAVHRGWDRALEREVAVKVVGADGQSDRFVPEARRTAQIRHPAVVEVFDVGSDGSDAFLVMELLEGESLEAVLKREQRLSPARAIQIAVQVCDALAASHALAVVHRDVKPANVFLLQGTKTQSASGSPEHQVRVKVLDFGVAKRVDSATIRTEPGLLVGTLRYMAPEQIRGDELDGRADLYALGVMLYRMLAGTMPFDAENMAQVLHAHLELPPKPLGPLLGADEALRARLDAALAQLLCKKPEGRPADATAARHLLEAALEGNSSGAPAARRFAPSPPPARNSLPRVRSEPNDVVPALLELELTRPARMPSATQADPSEPVSFEIDAALPPSRPLSQPVALAMPVMNMPDRFAPPPPRPDTWAGMPTSVSKRVAAYPLLTLAVYAFLFRLNLLVALLLLGLSIFGLVAYIQVKRHE